ncbi:hypothetical protein JHK82_042715 [Glycine max]|uniref:Uncharacterized protein n=1 Tax=Glycine max TaxID=3847 RepID=A0A0R0G982_SOYBN|nr:hypothetical protein JHK86_042741 [Glycine max]KAG4956994.1 hypothetical protein JHK85_043374 [Glycine max]KAG5105745.1 hypothetical protein JHK82_042715 [Glycine max]KAH1147775.1 hypothetical protein GYH30_042760 [Glycine max]
MVSQLEALWHVLPILHVTTHHSTIEGLHAFVQLFCAPSKLLRHHVTCFYTRGNALNCIPEAIIPQLELCVWANIHCHSKCRCFLPLKISRLGHFLEAIIHGHHASLLTISNYNNLPMSNPHQHQYAPLCHRVHTLPPKWCIFFNSCSSPSIITIEYVWCTSWRWQVGFPTIAMSMKRGRQ